MEPAVSVITVCRNAVDDLQKTKTSIDEQDCRDFEWIVVDGASTDGTREFLEKFQENNYKWISEPDNGLYFAMNKGLSLATGRRIWFMNAGDQFYDSHSIAGVAAIPADIDVCFGEVLFEDALGNTLGTRSEMTPHPLPDTLGRSDFQRGMAVCHQAFIPLRHLALEYDTGRYRLAADLDWMIRLVEQHSTSSRLDILARIKREGLSMKFWKRSKFERFLVLSRHFGWGITCIRHISIIWRGIRHTLKGGLWR